MREVRPRTSWVEALSPANLRQFAVEAKEAIDRALKTGDTSGLEQFLAEWQATAELDDSPDVLEEVRREKERRPINQFSSSAIADHALEG